MKVSIIIPVHNAAGSIRETLLSVMSQTDDNMEVILIDDCSLDDSIKIIEETAANDPRVILLRNSTNSGVSATRNKGLAAARGEYVRFVDDDDPLPEGSISSMLEVAEANDSDLVIGIMERVRFNRRMNIVATVALGARPVIDKYDPDLTQTFSVCNKMFRLDIIREHEIAFRPYRHAEDGLFLFEYLQYADKINGCDRIVYTYMRPETFENPTSSSRLDGETLHNIVEISDKILKMHPKAPDDFVERFNRKIASSALIEQFYRKLWMLEDEDVSFLLSELKEYKSRLSELTWDDVKSKHPELCLEKGFFTAAEAAVNPVFTIVVSPLLKEEDLTGLLYSAYYQRAPLFRLIMSESCRDMVPEGLKDMPNIVFTGQEQMQYVNAIESCESEYLIFVEDPLIFTFETLTRAAALMQDDELDYVSGICQRAGEERVVTPEVYRFSFAKETLGRSIGCSTQDRADMLLSNKVFRTRSLKKFLQSKGASDTFTVPDLAEKLMHERTRRVRYMTGCSDIRLRKKLIKASVDGSVLSAVRMLSEGGRPEKNLSEKVLFISEKQEMKPAFLNLFESLQCVKEVFVREAEEDPSVRLSKYAEHRMLLFENFDPALTPGNIPEGQDCYVLINYLCRDKSTAPHVLSELNDKNSNYYNA